MAIRKKTKGQTLSWPLEKRQKDKHCHGHQKKDKRANIVMAIRKKTKGQTLSWPLEKRTNKDLQNNTQKTND